mgnify:CR=1 FL=1
MPILFEKAPGKIILFGEHAVVYGQPAIAIPVTRVNATARVLPDFESDQRTIHIQALDINLDADLEDLPAEHPLGTAVRLTLEEVKPKRIPPLTLQLSSTIPLAAGMGSSAATAVAIIRALSSYLGKPLPPEVVSTMAYEVEKIHHGNPSGIDNNVIAHQKPVYFRREHPIEFITIEQPTHWVIADTGEKTPTRETVSAVQQLLKSDPERFEPIIQQIGNVVQQARLALISGDLPELGRLLDENQRLLEALDVSSPKLDTLIDAARTAGAFGAKLSGGGRGGNMIALVSENQITSVEHALIEAGAEKTITTILAARKDR